MKTPPIHARFALAAAGLLLVAGCTGEAEAIDVEGLRSAYLHNLEQVHELEVIQVRLYQDCMEAEGWTEHAYTVPPKLDEYNGFWEFSPRPAPEEAREVGYSRNYLYGREPELVNTPQWAMEELIAYWDGLGGPGFGDQIYGPNAQTVFDDFGEEDPEAVFDREYPEGGCIGDVVRGVYGSHDDLRDYLELEYPATSLAPVAAAKEDDRVREVEIDWSVCMKDAGYEYELPIDAELAAMEYRQLDADPAANEFYSTEISAEEADLAYADAVCNVEVGLDETRFEVLWEYMDRFVADHEVDYHAFGDAVEHYQERAAALVAEGRW